MKERPILFSGPMVRAILEGRKSQTRRIVMHRHAFRTFHEKSTAEEVRERQRMPLMLSEKSADFGRCIEYLTTHSRYGQPGDRLWVRETWQTLHHNGVRTVYRAAGEDPRTGWDDVPPERRPKMTWCPSIHMPRRASRITLEVTGIRVERLQAITEEDAKAEGVEPRFSGDYRLNGEHVTGAPYRHSFFVLWDEINGYRATWASNPWVWVVEFKRVSP